MKDDLLMEPKKNLKKPLIYGAIAFLIFVIAVIVFAIFQNSTSSKKNEIVPPEPKKEKIQSQFKPLVVEENNTIKPPVEAPQKEPKNTQAPALQPKPVPVEKTPQPQQIKPETAKEPVSVQKPAAAPKNIKPAPKKSVSKGKYYIQVAALLRYSKPNRHFLDLIKKAGFNYKLYHTYIVKNKEKIKVTKILVGPFATKQEAKEALRKVKAQISQTAFIFKVK